MRSRFTDSILKKSQHKLIALVCCLTVLGVNENLIAATVQSDPASQSCAPGYSADTDTNLVLNGDFDSLHGGYSNAGQVLAGSFTAGVPYAGDNFYAWDTSISIQEGNKIYGGGVLHQETFPGDPDNNMPPIANFVYAHGNMFGTENIVWSQSIIVEPDTSYLFTVYVSNMIAPGSPLFLPDTPVLAVYIDGDMRGDSYIVPPESLADGDVWTRVSRTFTTGSEQTSVVFHLTDFASGSIGDDLGFTAIGAFRCIPDNNSEPRAEDDTATTAYETQVTIVVLENDADPDGDNLTISTDGLTNPLNGSVEVNKAVIGSDTITYSPDPGFSGIDAFNYEISDGNGGRATATVTVNVTPQATDPDQQPDDDTNGTPDVNDDDDNGTDVAETPQATDPDQQPDDDTNGTPDVNDDDDNGTDVAETPQATDPDQQPDNDMDGIPDVIDIDDDNDGILDTVEGSGDFDLDGVANWFDLDADGDGILDLEESGLNELQQSDLDENADGQIDVSNAFGLNGLADKLETTVESGVTDYSNDSFGENPANSDADVQPNFLDLDSDNDAIPDVIEAGFIDVDEDGLMDANQVATMNPLDFDSDGIEDVLDLDSDNDGLTDALEGGSEDEDGDGRVDDFADGDGDGYDDYTFINPAPLLNSDNSDNPDYLDLNSDGDSLFDIAETSLVDENNDGLVDGFTDENGDGMDDATLVNPASDLDSDGNAVFDFREVQREVETTCCDTTSNPVGTRGGGGTTTMLFLGLLGLLCLGRTVKRRQFRCRVQDFSKFA